MSLFSRASQPNPAYQQALQHLLTAASGLQHKVEHELPVLLAEKSTDVEYFTPALTELQQALTAVKQHIKNPMLVGKTIVAFGGAFSAGKSSLINALIGEKRLQTQIDPTTSVPTYVCAGEAEAIYATNLFEQQIELSADEFAQITHDEQKESDVDISGLLRVMTIQTPKFPWEHLAFLDTPGYSKPEGEEQDERTDAQIALEQLNAADFIVWVVSASAGGISKDELNFLKSIKKDIHKLVVINRADTKTAQDVLDIQQLVTETLIQQHIGVVGVTVVSARKPKEYPLDQLNKFLNQCNQEQDNRISDQQLKQSLAEIEQLTSLSSQMMRAMDEDDLSDDALDLFDQQMDNIDQKLPKTLTDSLLQALEKLTVQSRCSYYEVKYLQQKQLHDLLDLAHAQQRLIDSLSTLVQTNLDQKTDQKVEDFKQLAQEQRAINAEVAQQQEALLLQKQAEDALRAAQALQNKPPRRSLEQIIESREDDIRRHKSDIYVTDDMYSSKVAKKVSKARDTYAENAYEDALVLVDMSLFGSGNAGLYLTSEALFFYKPAGERYAIKLSDITRIRHDSDDCEISISGKHKLDDDAGSGTQYLHYITASRRTSMDVLVDCINEYINQDK